MAAYHCLRTLVDVFVCTALTQPIAGESPEALSNNVVVVTCLDADGKPAVEARRSDISVRLLPASGASAGMPCVITRCLGLL